MVGTPHQISFAWSYKEELDWLGMPHIWGVEKYTKDLVAKP